MVARYTLNDSSVLRRPARVPHPNRAVNITHLADRPQPSACRVWGPIIAALYERHNAGDDSWERHGPYAPGSKRIAAHLRRRYGIDAKWRNELGEGWVHIRWPTGGGGTP